MPNAVLAVAYMINSSPDCQHESESKETAPLRTDYLSGFRNVPVPVQTSHKRTSGACQKLPQCRSYIPCPFRATGDLIPV